jgi:hypothetical protein
MRRPDDDVFLRDGQGHMVGREPYRTHINTTIERYQVGFRFNHKRQNPHICTSFRNHAAAIIERSMAGMQMAKTVMPPESVDVHAHVMGPMFHIPWLIFRREKGGYDSSNHRKQFLN